MGASEECQIRTTSQIKQPTGTALVDIITTIIDQRNPSKSIIYLLFALRASQYFFLLNRQDLQPISQFTSIHYEYELYDNFEYLQEMKMQLSHLAETPNMSTYEQKPVENFGANLLELMNKADTKEVTRKRNIISQPIVLKARPKGLGLGAQLEGTEKIEQFQTGNYILVNQKPHDGLIGIVIQVNQTNLLIELKISGSILKIDKDKSKKIDEEEMRKIESEKEKGKEKEKKKRLKWVIPNIRVKVVDKHSSFYLKKVIVTQLINEREFQCVGEQENGSKAYLRNLRQKDIQTVVPKVGQTVIVLQGKYTGQKALILQKKRQNVIVQTINQLQIIKLSEDDISQLVQF